jgi:hypothetical protein
MRIRAITIATIMVVGCGSSDGASQSQDPASPGGGGTVVGAADNLPSATPSTCGAPGQAPGETFVASCADGATLPVIQKGGEPAFCADKRFGTFFWQDVTNSQGTERWLYFCKSPSESEWFPFGRDYTHVVVVSTGKQIVGLALTTGHNYRCFSDFDGISPDAKKQVIDNREPLPLGKELCNGIAVVERTDAATKVTKNGHTLQMTVLGAPDATAPDGPQPCDELRDWCCPTQSDPDSVQTCKEIAEAFASEGNQTACQNRIDTICH